MILKQLFAPRNIAIIGASESLKKAGGQILHNLLKGDFLGDIFPVNPNHTTIQSLPCFQKIEELPPVDLAVLSVPSKYCYAYIDELSKKGTKAYIILSAGFSETGSEGASLQKQIHLLARERELNIIGPNCIGVFTPNYHGIFVSPPLRKSPQGVDFVSASGALAVFFFEQAYLHGLRFHSFFSVGNSLQIGAEELLEYWAQESGPIQSKTKIAYIEQVRDPQKLYESVRTLVNKGYRVITMLPGNSEAGARATLSHTGALSQHKNNLELLLVKAGAHCCKSRTELLNLALASQSTEITGKNIAVITHAGGPAVLLTDELSRQGFHIPEFNDSDKETLRNQFHPEAGVNNPVDILATGTGSHLAFAIKTCANIPEIDGIVVIYGNSGLEDLYATYTQLSETIQKVDKPVYTVAPSEVSAREEMNLFIEKDTHLFTDEVELAKALGQLHRTYELEPPEKLLVPEFDSQPASVIPETKALQWIEAAGVPLAESVFISTGEAITKLPSFPLVAKITGSAHKSDHHGVITDINTPAALQLAIDTLSKHNPGKRIWIQEQLKGLEIYVGIVAHEGVGYELNVGFGGVWVELFPDRIKTLLPVSDASLLQFIENWSGAKVLKGYRNAKGINLPRFVKIIQSLCEMLRKNPKIRELEINPLIAFDDQIKAVDILIVN